MAFLGDATDMNTCPSCVESIFKMLIAALSAAIGTMPLALFDPSNWGCDKNA
jgi:hypothetical protein